MCWAKKGPNCANRVPRSKNPKNYYYDDDDDAQERPPGKIDK